MRAHLDGLAKNALGFLHREMADGVKDPVEREAQFAQAALPGSFQASKDRLEAARIEVAPHVDNADRDVDLGVNDALLGQMLDHAPGGQFVIFRRNEAARDGLEALDEAGEVVEAIEGFGFGEGDGTGIMAGAELDQSRWQNGALEVQMQFGLRQPTDEAFDLRHLHSLPGWRRLLSAGRAEKARCVLLRGARAIAPGRAARFSIRRASVEL